jgi:NAD(P)-dependent dehydrogenase (short-subunit alcohol dehydrogenase family)
VLTKQAGVLSTGPLLRVDPEKFASMFDVNVLGAFRMIQAFTPMLVSTALSTGGKRSKIVNIGSVLSGGAPWHVGYSTTKAAIQAMSDVARREMAPLGVDVVTLELGE